MREPGDCGMRVFAACWQSPRGSLLYFAPHIR